MMMLHHPYSRPSSFADAQKECIADCSEHPEKRKRQLWNVLVNGSQRSIVAAGGRDEAWRIVAALIHHEDLPDDLLALSLMPCQPSQAKNILHRAEILGIADGFLAHVGHGFFVTHLGGLAPERDAALLLEMVA